MSIGDREKGDDLEGGEMEKDKRLIIITNNPMVRDEFSEKYQVDYQDISFEEILKKVRDKVHLGHQLLTHPLSGSVKPNETPYKSIMISTKLGKSDFDAMEIIENAIHACSKFEFRSDKYAEQVYKDFQYVDHTLISSALQSIDFLK